MISHNLPLLFKDIFSDTCKTYRNSVRNDQFTVDALLKMCVGLWDMDAYMYVHGYVIQIKYGVLFY